MDIGFSMFPKVVGSGIIFRWPTHRSDSGACGTRTRSPAFAPNPRCAVSSVIRRRASSRSPGAQKNGLRVLRANSFGLVRRSLTLLLAANKRLNTAYVLKESFGQLWDYEREGWARRFFENWRASLKWQRLAPYEKF